MKIDAALQKLIPSHRFGISRDMSTEYTSILLRIEHNGIIGFGEAFPSNRYEKSAEHNLKIFKNAPFTNTESLFTHFQPKVMQRWTEQAFNNIDSLISGYTSAYYDYFGNKLGISVAELIGFWGENMPLSSFTIGIDEEAVIRQKVKEAEQYPILKIKVGTDRDEEIMGIIRELTDKPVRVDANEGWDKKEALDRIHWLESQNVEFVEQPIPAGNYDDVRWLQERSPLPLIADEDCRHVEDVPKLMDCYDGINIKLVKCGGITPALQMIATAKSFAKSVMLGCMVESSAGISPAAMLGGGVDYLDLDGNLLLSNDPFSGPRAENGKFGEFSGKGLGVEPVEEIDWKTIYSS